MAEKTRARGGLDTIDIKGKQYVTVAERIKAVTDIDSLDNNLYEIERWERFELGGKLFLTCHIIVGAKLNDMVSESGDVKTYMADTRKRYSGTSQISFSGGMVNATSGYENAETSALGRALGFAGIGLIEGVASADEIHKANHAKTIDPPAPEEPAKDVREDVEPITKDQITSLMNAIKIKSNNKATKETAIEALNQLAGTIREVPFTDLTHEEGEKLAKQVAALKPSAVALLIPEVEA